MAPRRCRLRCVRERPVAKLQHDRRGVFHFEATRLVRGHRLKAFQIAEQVPEQIDIVNQVDENRAAAFSPAPCGVEVVIGLEPRAQGRRADRFPKASEATISLARRTIGLCRR